VHEAVSKVFQAEAKEFEAEAAAERSSARLKTAVAGMVVGTLAAGVDPRLGKIARVATDEAQKETSERAQRAHTRRTAAGSVMSDNRDAGKAMVSGACSRALEASALQNTSWLVDQALVWTKWLGLRGRKQA
jgi:hypothetical protein